MLHTPASQPSELDDFVAFDYQQQAWVSGIDAVHTRLKQIIGELPLMKSAEYRKFINIEDHEAKEAIERLRRELAMLYELVREKAQILRDAGISQSDSQS